MRAIAILVLLAVAGVGASADGPSDSRLARELRQPARERSSVADRVESARWALGRGPRAAGALLGRSAGGRAIRGRFFGAPEAPRRVLVVGCIHATECAGTEIAARLPVECPSPDSDLLVVPNLNPDGYAAGIRVNGRGVDLNRNFPSGWRGGGRPFDPEYPGPRPLSEPETRLARELVRAFRPHITIWFHQQYEPPLVRAWGASVPEARRYARLAGLPFRRLPWLAGTAPNWQNHRFPGTTSFVVELPLGPISERAAARQAQAIAQLADRS